jgi:hypothetical protein
MQLTPAMIFLGFVLPALIVGVGLALAWRAWRGECAADGRWIAGPLFAAALVVAFPRIEQAWPTWPPGTGSAVFLLFYFAIALGVLGFFEGLLRPPLWLAALLLLLVWRLMVRAIIAPQVPRLISEFNAEAWIDAATAAALLWWLAMQQLARTVRGAATPIVLGILCAGWAVVLVTWHIIRSGELAGTLAVLCATAAVVSIWRPRITLATGGVSVVVLVLLGVIVHAYFYTDDTFSPQQQVRTAILLASPLLAFAGDLPGIRTARPSWRLAARVVPVILAVGLVAGLSAKEYANADAADAAVQDE